MSIRCSMANSLTILFLYYFIYKIKTKQNVLSAPQLSKPLIKVIMEIYFKDRNRPCINVFSY